MRAMYFKRSAAAVAAASVMLTGCGNTVYGPRRVVQAGYFDSGDRGIKYTCQQPGTLAGTPAPTPTPTSIDSNGLNLVYEFNRLACVSVNSRTDPIAAAAMMDAGFTLTRLRCNDFFAERAAHQMQARFWRGTIAPVSAILTGVIGLVNFTDSERTDAIQILGITQAATVAGFELYEQEFLFDTENVNAVRRLVMRALDAHSDAAMTRPITGFQHGVRHLTDNQMICTPANILELVRTSIAEGEVRAFEGGPVSGRHSSGAALLEAMSRTRTAQALGAATLTDDQLGSLWWLAQNNLSQAELEVVADRLGPSLKAQVLTGAAGSLTLVPAKQATLAMLSADLSQSTSSSFAQTVASLKSAIATRGAATPVAAVSEIRFSLESSGPGRSIDVTASPGS